MKLVAYLRVSSDGQKDNTSFAEQLARIEAYAQAYGHQLLYVFRDVETASGAKRRPGFERMLTAVQSVADGVICAKLDRFARSALEGLRTAEALRLSGKQLVLLDINLDTSTPMGEFMLVMLLGFAQLERRVIDDRVSSGRARAKAEGGRYGGGLPYGYRSERTDGLKRLVPDATEQAVITSITSMRAAGCTYAQITAALNARGEAPRMADRWNDVMVRAICLRNGFARKYNTKVSSATTEIVQLRASGLSFDAIAYALNERGVRPARARKWSESVVRSQYWNVKAAQREALLAGVSI